MSHGNRLDAAAEFSGSVWQSPEREAGFKLHCDLRTQQNAGCVMWANLR